MCNRIYLSPPIPPQKGVVHVATDEWEDEAAWTYYPLLEKYILCALWLLLPVTVIMSGQVFWSDDEMSISFWKKNKYLL